MTQKIDEPQEMGILQRRKIEALIIKPIYDILKRDFGIEKAQAVIEEAIGNAAISEAKVFAEKEGKPTTLESFVALQPLWEADNALEIDILESTSEVYAYNVKRCRYAEMYRELGLGEIGSLLSCNRDAKFIEGYAPNVTLTRPHTLMKGDSLCDFHYQLKRVNDEK